jgi:hypothetical protein
MNIEPLSKKIYDKAISLGITEIILAFSGGSDEGYLNVSFVWEDKPKDFNPDDEHAFQSEVEEWGFEAYEYSGAGEGNDYGDNVTYDLVNKTATTDEWYMARTEGDSTSAKLKISKE